MRSIRLVVVDLDGTLIGVSGEPTPRVREAVAATREAGVSIAICTGRPLASAAPIAHRLGLHGPHVTFNGALVKDPEQATAVFRSPLPADCVGRLIDRCRAADLCLELYTEETHFVERDWSESRRHAESIRVSYEFANFDEFIGRADLIKAQIVTADDRARQAARAVAEEFAGRLSLSVALPIGPAAGMECVNVVAEGVSKGTAVRALVDWYGLDVSQVAGAGDAANDLPMLEAVGYRIAMGNAEPAVKARADLICADVDSDGLAEALLRITNIEARI
ncbi:MAG TPA: Cof-type HAD-IIB family hydrolase [Chloroflexota bacterium]|nr:Cof-type HAD-IIB family hydrolase [Chloroflexota bacterium]